jgi:hypothetical protein
MEESRRLRASTPPPDPDDMNEKRSEWAWKAIHEFQRLTGAEKVDAVSDLLADLMHWCDRSGQSFEAELRRGRCHYRAETES